jgi:hypothetical protein
MFLGSGERFFDLTNGCFDWLTILWQPLRGPHRLRFLIIPAKWAEIRYTQPLSPKTGHFLPADHPIRRISTKEGKIIEFS